jgi:putative transcriptional regulator
MRLRQYFLVFVTGLCAAFGARAADLGQSPVVLVAKPQLGEFYRGTVLFARPVGGGRHIGFIVNRPTPVTLATLFPGHTPSQKLTDPVFLGGPLHADAVFAVVRRTEAPGGRSIPLAKDMFLVMDSATVDRVIEQNRSDARFYVGLVLWQPGELESELQRGFWYVMDHDSGLIFRKTTDGLWEELVRRSSRTVM